MKRMPNRNQLVRMKKQRQEAMRAWYAKKTELINVEGSASRTSIIMPAGTWYLSQGHSSTRLRHPHGYADIIIEQQAP